MSEDPVEEIKRQKLEELQDTQGRTSRDAPIPIDGADELEALTDEHEVVLVDFHAEWCGPCKQLAPIVDQLAAETAATVVKVDIDQHSDLAGSWNVRSVPTLLLFADGEPVERVRGLQPYDRLAGLVEQHA